MIDTGLAVGCLHEVIKDALKQGDHAVKYQKWLAWGHEVARMGPRKVLQGILGGRICRLITYRKLG